VRGTANVHGRGSPLLENMELKRGRVVQGPEFEGIRGKSLTVRSTLGELAMSNRRRPGNPGLVAAALL
jgi:hypothetical protein